MKAGSHHSPEANEKNRQDHLGLTASPEAREKNRQAQLRPETRERKRQAGLARKHSPETREKMRRAHLKGGYIAKNGYHVIVLFRREYLVQRLIWQQTHGSIPEGHVIHHINGIRDDNRLENLAMMTRGEHTTLHKSKV